MARILIEQAEVFAAGDTTTALGTISGITVDGLEISKEAQSLAIENNINLNEAYTGSITMRTIQTQTDEGENILSTTAEDDIYGYVSFDGSVPTASLLKLSGSNGETIYMDDVYLMGHEDFSNNRVEIVLMATRTSTSQGVIDNSDPTA
jgi:hypothetical protein